MDGYQAIYSYATHRTPLSTPGAAPLVAEECSEHTNTTMLEKQIQKLTARNAIGGFPTIQSSFLIREYPQVLTRRKVARNRSLDVNLTFR